MKLLCFDISSGGISGAVFDADLNAARFGETRWVLETDDKGSATLSIPTIEAQFKRIIRELGIVSADAICIDSFMHNIVLLDAKDEPLTPVFTWLDQRGDSGVALIRKG